MQRAMARQAEAERERRAKVINAQGELQASSRLKDAAKVIESDPVCAAAAVSADGTELGPRSRLDHVFPLPMDMLRPFLAGGDTLS